MQIFVSGSLAYDRIMDFPGKFSDHILPEKIHILNVCFLVNGVVEKFGGTAGNIAYNLALLGERPIILSAAGRDFDSYEKWLRGHGLSLDGIRRVGEELTAGAYITTDQADNQITGFNPGAMKYPSNYEFNGIAPNNSLAIVSPGNLEDMVAYSRIYKSRRVPYIFDPGQQIPVMPKPELIEMITGSELLVANDYELQMIEQAGGFRKQDLLTLTKGIITTLGEKGSVISTNAKETEIPAARVSKVLDPTGAGDAYRAGLIKGLARGKSLEDAARMGSTCASYAVECYGTQEHSFSTADFHQRYTENFGRFCQP